MSNSSKVTDETFRGFYRLDIESRLQRLVAAAILSPADAEGLRGGGYILSVAAADRMIENVIGVFGLPLALIANVRVNGNDYMVPMVVEEPSVVAAASAGCTLARKAGGFSVSSDESLLIGQVELREIPDRALARRAIEAATRRLLAVANAVHPKMTERGGGARAIEIRDAASDDSLIVHLLVDTCDAMGANLVNSQCEAVSPLLTELSGGRAGLRILSNLADRSLVRASLSLPTELLARGSMSGGDVRDAIIEADHFAASDPYRAVTHNKGIMNGIDPVAIATGNDWRAIEAGAHAWAARSGRYRGLTRWREGAQGELHGTLELPLKPGIVGAAGAVNPGARLALSILGVRHASELAQVMAAVGLAQNFAAIRALATEGIQKGHMRLHARSVVALAGIPDEQAGLITERLVASGQIKAWKASELYCELLGADDRLQRDDAVSAAGKIILLGEHSVVHGRRALAVPIPDAIRASVRAIDDGRGIWLRVPAWRISHRLGSDANLVDQILGLIVTELGLADRCFELNIETAYPRGAGLGGSASLAVVVCRALDRCYSLGLDDTAINRLAYRCETIAHGDASGIDNTVATFARPLLFRRGEPPSVEAVEIVEEFELIVCVTPAIEPTARMVQQVADLKRRQAAAVERIFDTIDVLAGEARDALARFDPQTLGSLMNLNHGLLNALGVSTPEIERLVSIARRAGALGAKLTGAGGGGAIIALPGKNCDADVEEALGLTGASVYRTTVHRFVP